MNPAPDMLHWKLGRKPQQRFFADIAVKARPYIKAALPHTPRTWAWGKDVTFGMFLNDRYGDCLLPGSNVVAPQAGRGYRARYDGLAVELCVESGKRLAVTGNHPVLTARGFVRARDIQEGDYLVSSDFPETVAVRMDDDFDHAPALVEEVVESYLRVGASLGEVRRHVYDPVQFNGDARFFQGEVDVVDADRFLHDGDVPPLGEVERHLGFGLGSESGEPLDGRSAPLAHARLVPAAAPGLLRSERTYAPLLDGHAAIAEHASGRHRPHLHASATKPTHERLATDPELAGELLRRFPGLVTTDRVRQVRRFDYAGHVYDLSTEQRWYIANGIFAHNCTCAALGHMEQVHSARAGHAERPVDADIFELYHQTGVDEHLSDDDGRIMERVLAYMKKNGIRQTAGDPNNPAGTYEKIIGYAAVNHIDLDEVATAGYLFGGLYAGLALPKSAIMQTNVRKWSCAQTDNAPGSWGGHAVWVTAVNSIGPVCATWGMRVQMSWCFWRRYVDELYVAVTDDWTQNTTAPSGFARDELIRDLGLL